MESLGHRSQQQQQQQQQLELSHRVLCLENTPVFLNQLVDFHYKAPGPENHHSTPQEQLKPVHRELIHLLHNEGEILLEAHRTLMQPSDSQEQPDPSHKTGKDVLPGLRCCASDVLESLELLCKVDSDNLPKPPCFPNPPPSPDLNTDNSPPGHLLCANDESLVSERVDKDSLGHYSHLTSLPSEKVSFEQNKITVTSDITNTHYKSGQPSVDQPSATKVQCKAVDLPATVLAFNLEPVSQTPRIIQIPNFDVLDLLVQFKFQEEHPRNDAPCIPLDLVVLFEAPSNKPSTEFDAGASGLSQHHVPVRLRSVSDRIINVESPTAKEKRNHKFHSTSARIKLSQPLPATAKSCSGLRKCSDITFQIPIGSKAETKVQSTEVRQSSVLSHRSCDVTSYLPDTYVESKHTPKIMPCSSKADYPYLPLPCKEYETLPGSSDVYHHSLEEKEYKYLHPFYKLRNQENCDQNIPNHSFKEEPLVRDYYHLEFLRHSEMGHEFDGNLEKTMAWEKGRFAEEERSIIPTKKHSKTSIVYEVEASELDSDRKYDALDGQRSFFTIKEVCPDSWSDSSSQCNILDEQVERPADSGSATLTRSKFFEPTNRVSLEELPKYTVETIDPVEAIASVEPMDIGSPRSPPKIRLDDAIIETENMAKDYVQAIPAKVIINGVTHWENNPGKDHDANPPLSSSLLRGRGSVRFDIPPPLGTSSSASSRSSSVECVRGTPLSTSAPGNTPVGGSAISSILHKIRSSVLVMRPTESSPVADSLSELFDTMPANNTSPATSRTRSSSTHGSIRGILSRRSSDYATKSDETILDRVKTILTDETSPICSEKASPGTHGSVRMNLNRLLKKTVSGSLSRKNKYRPGLDLDALSDFAMEAKQRVDGPDYAAVLK